MKSRLNNLSKLLFVTGCVSVLAYNLATAAPLTYDMNQPVVRSEFSAPNKINLTGNVNFEDKGQRINLSLRETDVQQVLRMFADKAGLNIVFHESARGRVTLDLVDVRLEDAFKMVMKMTNLTYVIKDKTMLVVGIDSAEKVNLTKDNIAILPVKYADAAYLAGFLNDNIFGMNTPGLTYGPIVTTNADRNELLIFGTDNDYQMAKKIVERFDKKPMMTTFKVNHTTPFEMAKMICETLFNVPAQAQNKKSTVNTDLQTGSKEQPQDGAIGGGSVACVYSSNVSTDNITSYSTKPTMTLYVQSELGTITLVGGTEQQIQMVNDFILDNDRKQPQALLEISIIALSEEGSREFSNEWGFQNKHIRLSFNGIAGGSSITSSSKDSSNNFNPYYWHGPHAGNVGTQLYQSITYLIKNNKGRVLSNPKVVVTNGKETTIDLTHDYVESTTVQVLNNSGSSGTPVSQKTFETGDDAGIKVSITPFISPDGYVSMDLKPEYSSQLAPVTDRDPYTREIYTAATLLQRHNLDLKSIRVKDEETLLLGGMVSESEMDSVGKVPILGDIPIIGFFFRGQSRSLTKEEILFMITPRIIKDTEDVQDL